MNKFESRVVKLEALGANGWRAYQDRPTDEIPDHALVGYLRDGFRWPPGYEPTDDELVAIAGGKRRKRWRAP